MVDVNGRCKWQMYMFFVVNETDDSRSQWLRMKEHGTHKCAYLKSAQKLKNTTASHREHKMSGCVWISRDTPTQILYTTTAWTTRLEAIQKAGQMA